MIVPTLVFSRFSFRELSRPVPSAAMPTAVVSILKLSSPQSGGTLEQVRPRSAMSRPGQPSSIAVPATHAHDSEDGVSHVDISYLGTAEEAPQGGAAACTAPASGWAAPPGGRSGRALRGAASLRTAPTGLTADEVERRLEEYGPNVVAEERRLGVLRLLGRAVMNPLVILLSVLAAVSLLTGDLRSSVVMAVMVLLGVVLRFVQEARADAAAAKLKAMISVTATVIREGQPTEVPLGHLVPGDVVELAAGDMIPADVRSAVLQGPVRHPGEPDRRIAAGREIRTQRDERPHRLAPGAEEHLLPGHQRRKRHGDRGDRRHRPDDLLGRHGRPPWWTRRPRPASTRASAGSPG